MREIILIKFDDDCFIKIKFEGADVGFDDWVEIIFCDRQAEYTLLEDIWGYVLSRIKYCFESAVRLEIREEFRKIGLGVAQNNYYHCIAEELPLNAEFLKEENEFWIGDKYNCFMSKNWSTWVYFNHGKSWIEITPLYTENWCDNPKIPYEEFMKNYNVLYRKEISDKMISCAKMRME